MKKLDFYKEGSTLFYIKRDIRESGFYNILTLCIFSRLCYVLGNNSDINWLKNMFEIISILILLGTLYNIFTEPFRPENSKYFNTIINSNLYYEQITPKKEGFNPDNQLINFEVIKFIDDKEDVVKIISNNSLPWGNRKVHISKEYLPYKKQIIDYLNENYTKT